VFADGEVLAAPAAWPLDLDDGSFPVGGAWYAGMVPLPFGAAGPVRFGAIGPHGERVAVAGSGVAVRPAGGAEYREEFPGA
jgi:hypothetical protein